MSQYLPTLVEWMGVIAVTLLLTLSPALTHKRPVKFVYPRRELVISLALLAVAAAGMVFYLHNAAPPAQPAPGAVRYTQDDLLRQAAVSASMIAPFLLALAVRRQPLLSAGLSRRSLRPGLELGIALGVIAIFLINKTYAILHGLTGSQVLYLPAALIAAFAVEFTFRGYLQLRLMDALGETWGWVVTAVLYALWQIPQKVFVEHAALPALGLSLGIALLTGLLLGWIMRRSGSILATTLYHAVHTWITVL